RLLSGSGDHRVLCAFPTRRSSDLEQGEEGARAQREIVGIARESGMRLLGPNCLGVLNLEAGWYGTFSNASSVLRLPPGPIGIVRSEEHTSELQSRENLACRLLLEK